MRGHVVSDLHLLTNRAHADVRATLDEGARASDFFVLNGDIFDFQWSALPNHSATANAARDWIDDLVTRHPRCDFYFTLGNHDCVPEYRAILGQLSARHANLEWDPSFVRLGRTVFLHGDVAIRTMSPERFARHRRRWARRRRRPRILHTAYDWAGRSRIDGALQHIAFPRRVISKRILSYLEHCAPDARDGLREVYFGHTHLPFTGFRYRNVTFHNTGSAVRPKLFRMYGVDVDDEQ